MDRISYCRLLSSYQSVGKWHFQVRYGTGQWLKPVVGCHSGTSLLTLEGVLDSDYRRRTGEGNLLPSLRLADIAMLSSSLMEVTFMVRRQVKIVQLAVQKGLVSWKGWGIILTSSRRHGTACSVFINFFEVFSPPLHNLYFMC